MTTIEKQTLRQWLADYVAHVGSQNKAAAQIGVSAATLSAIANEQWEKIKDEMLRRIADHVRPVNAGEWQVVETSALREMHTAMTVTQAEAGCLWITGEAGAGKSTAARLYREQHREVFVMLCSEDMRKSDFVRGIADAIGLQHDGLTLRQTLYSVAAALSAMEQPLLIFDEADKPNDNVFHYYINLYNMLEERCGIVFLSTNYIAKRINTGLRCGKRGYKEIHSRIGRKFFELERTTAHDVAAICAANGITDEKKQARIIHESEECDFDLRRVKKSVNREKKIKR